MNYRKHLLPRTLCLILLLATACQTGGPEADVVPVEKPPLEKFQDMKFGMFIHWGLYAAPAGVWEGRYLRGIGEWIMRRFEIPVAEYEKLAEDFNPIKFNADVWAQLAQDAGMKYMVITSKHHDGFAMFHSQASQYNIVDATPFERDPMKELAAANKKRGIGFGFYYSQAQDWHEPNAAGNTWDFPEERDPQPYVEGKVIPQVKELLANYRDLALIWFDTPQLLSEEQVISLKRLVKQQQPDCLVNNRIGYDQGDYEQMGDNAIPTMVFDWQVWEVPATLNDTWGFKKDDQNWKDPRDLIYKLTDIVSKGGNYLLNVGPTALGVIPQASQNILRTIGEWLRVNGESIYGTGHSPFIYRDLTWKCTTKPGKLFFHIVNWPGNELTIEGLESPVKKAWFLKNREEVAYSQAGNRVTLSFPDQMIDPFNSVLVLEIADEEAVVTPGYAYKDSQETYFLFARDARIRGEEASYDWDTRTVSGFQASESPQNELWWYHFPFESGSYSVSIEYSCEADSAGSDFYVTNRIDRGSPETLDGTIESTEGQFKTFHLGSFELAQGAENQIRFGLGEDDRSAGVKVRKILLSRN